MRSMRTEEEALFIPGAPAHAVSDGIFSRFSNLKKDDFLRLNFARMKKITNIRRILDEH